MNLTPTRRSSAIVSVAALLLAAGCASSTSKPTQPATNAAPPAASSTSGGAGSSSANTAASVSTGTSVVKGTSTTVLTAPDGHTLYYFMPDTAAAKATCTGSCASAWPPLMFSGSGTPTAGTGVTGTLTAAMGANGDQISYNGHPLYEFAQDKAAGDAKGEGLLGKWHVATPGLAMGGGAAPSSTSSSNGYGNY